jgi:hypothetical protein
MVCPLSSTLCTRCHTPLVQPEVDSGFHLCIKCQLEDNEANPRPAHTENRSAPPTDSHPTSVAHTMDTPTASNSTSNSSGSRGQKRRRHPASRPGSSLDPSPPPPPSDPIGPRDTTAGSSGDPVPEPVEVPEAPRGPQIVQYMTVSCALGTILKGKDREKKDIIEIIERATRTMHTIAMRATELIRYFVVKKGNENGTDARFPNIDSGFVYAAVMASTICDGKPGRTFSSGNPQSRHLMFPELCRIRDEMDGLDEIDNNDQWRIQNLPDRSGLKQSINYMCNQMVAETATSIKTHLGDRVLRVVKKIFHHMFSAFKQNGGSRAEKKRNKEERKRLKNEMLKVRCALLESDFKAETLAEDVRQAKVLEHLRAMLKLPPPERLKEFWSSATQKLATTFRLLQLSYDLEVKLFAITPLRTSFIPAFMTVDAAQLPSLFNISRYGDADHEMRKWYRDRDKRREARKVQLEGGKRKFYLPSRQQIKEFKPSAEMKKRILHMNGKKRLTDAELVQRLERAEKEIRIIQNKFRSELEDRYANGDEMLCLSLSKVRSIAAGRREHRGASWAQVLNRAE